MRRALGKGLSHLIADQFEQATSEAEISAISPNRRQPRTNFDESTLEELAASIREHGIIQPLLVRELGAGRYELIAGERRLRAAKLAGLSSVPIIARPSSSRDSLELALIENLQREDIGALECARAYRQLIDEFGSTQEQVADKVGKSRPAVANTLRLLRLPQRIQEALEEGKISEGHARALLAVENPPRQLAILEKILAEGLSVRDVENLSRIPVPNEPRPKPKVATEWVAIQDRLSERFGSPVSLAKAGKGGRMTIEFYSDDDLTRILDALGVEL